VKKTSVKKSINNIQKAAIFALLLWAINLSGQNVAINTTGVPAVNSSVLLDLSNNLTNGNTGFLAPYVALTANNTAAPIAAPSAGLIVYNTATAGSYPNNVIPGYYYWDGTQWQLILTGSGSSTLGWSILGNAGTNPATNFLGTTDPNDLVLKANNTEGLRISSEVSPVLPKVGINDATPGAIGSAMLELKGPNTSLYGPHIQFVTSADNYPVSQYINWSHDDIDITFDAYWDGIWRSAYASASSFQIVKWSNLFWIRYAAPGAAGTAITTWNPGFVMTSAGLIGLGTNSPQQNLSVMNGENVDQSNQNSGFINNGLGTGNGIYFGSNSAEGIACNRNSSTGYEKNGLQFYTAALLAMNISNLSSGTTPGQVSITNGLNVDQGNANNGFLDNNLNTGNGITFGLVSGEGIASKRIAGGARQYGLDIYTAFLERMTILNNGNVGVGDTVPTTLLQVGGGGISGKLSVYSKDYFNGQFQIGNPTSNSETSIDFISGVTAFGDAATSSSGNNYMWNMGAGNYGNGGNTFSIANVGLGRPVITLLSSGNVGIGATGPARELEVGGVTNTARIDGLTTAGTFYSTTTAPTAASSVMFANNTTGDVQALAPSATNGQVLAQTATGPAWQSMGALNNIQVLTTTGTYTPTVGTTRALVVLVGGGGGGGGATSGSSPNVEAAGGGGAGGYCVAFINNISGTYAYTIGAAGGGGAATPTGGTGGGATTFVNGVTTYTANGGSGGAGANTGGPLEQLGGAGGTALNGILNITGASGLSGQEISNASGATCLGASGAGGSSIYGGGGAGRILIPNVGKNGNPGAGPGSGGSGAGAQYNGTVGSGTGGAGAAGNIIVYEYK